LVAQLLRAAAGVEPLSGCRLYVVNASLAEPDAVWVTEVWDSERSTAPLGGKGLQD
jgi:quinol monooxygenase YgiN